MLELIEDGAHRRACARPDAGARRRGRRTSPPTRSSARGWPRAALAAVSERTWDRALERLADGYRRALAAHDGPGRGAARPDGVAASRHGRDRRQARAAPRCASRRPAAARRRRRPLLRRARGRHPHLPRRQGRVRARGPAPTSTTSSSPGAGAPRRRRAHELPSVRVRHLQRLSLAARRAAAAATCCARSPRTSCCCTTRSGPRGRGAARTRSARGWSRSTTARSTLDAARAPRARAALYRRCCARGSGAPTGGRRGDVRRRPARGLRPRGDAAAALGVDPAFRPRAATARRGEHVLYVGRLRREKGVFELLEAAARVAGAVAAAARGRGPRRRRPSPRAPSASASPAASRPALRRRPRARSRAATAPPAAS